MTLLCSSGVLEPLSSSDWLAWLMAAELSHAPVASWRLRDRVIWDGPAHGDSDR